MSLSIGELVGYIRADDGQFIRALDESGQRMAVFRRDADGQLRQVQRDFGMRGAAAGNDFSAHLDEALSSLHPDVLVDVDSRPADEEVAALYRRLEELRDARIGVDIPPEHALAELEEIRAALARVSGEHPDVDIRTNADSAVFALNLLQRSIADVDAANPTITVHTNTNAAVTALRRVDDAQRRVGDDNGIRRSSSSLAGLASGARSAAGALGSAAGQAGMMAGMLGAAIPAAAGLVATLANIAPAAAVGATAVFALAQAVSVVKIGTSGIGGALKAAFAGGGAAAGGAAGGVKKAAGAMNQVKQATEQAALANKRAARSVEDAERSLSDAQKAAARAQKDLTQARADAVRQLEDMNNSLADSKLDERQGVLDVQAAQENLDKVKRAGFDASAEEQSAAQLDYDKAVQALKESQTQTTRLSKDTADANKKGVEGSKDVVDAKEQVSQANRDVQDQVRAVKDAEEDQARTAKQGLEAIAQAQQAVADSAGGGGGGAAGGVNAFAAAMAKLSPNAQAFVRQLIALKGQWDSLKRAVQDKLFEGLASELKSTAGAVLPVLKTGLVDTAGALNLMAKGAMGAAREVAQDGTLGKAMKSASGGLRNMAGIPGIIIKGFTQIAAAGGPTFMKLTAAIGTGAASIGDKLNSAFKSGQMTKMIDTAVKLIGELMDIAGNVGSILMSVMSAAQGAGGGMLGVLKQITGALADAFASPAVQSGMHALFSTMAVAAKTAAPLLVMALKALGPIFAQLGPPAQILIKALGDGLRPIIKALGPVLASMAGAIGKLVIAFAPLLPVIGDLIAQLLPPLVPILDTLGKAFADSAPAISVLAKALGTSLKPVIAGVADVIKRFTSQQAKDLTMVFQQLIPLIPQLVPAMVQLGQSIGQILIAVAPLLPQLMLLGTQMLLAVLPAVIQLVPPMVKLTNALTRIATWAITKILIPAMSQLILFMSGLLKKLQPAIDAATKVAHGIAAPFEWLYDHLVGHSVIPDLINAIVRWFAGLPGKAFNALSSLGSKIAGRASSAGASMLSTIRSHLTSAVTSISGLPGRAASALGNLGTRLYNSGQALIRGFINGIKSMGSGVASAASNLLSTARDFFPNSPAKRGPFAGRGWVGYSGQAIGNALASSMLAQQNTVRNAARSLTASAQQGLGGANSPFASLMSAPGASTAGGAGGRGGVMEHRIRVDVTGADGEFKKVMRKIVRVDGRGSSQTAFGGATG